MNGHWQPLAFTGQFLSLAEQRYSTFIHELLPAYHTVRHFQSWIRGCYCCLYSDHCLLTQALLWSSDPWSTRQQRHLSAIAEFVSDIIYQPRCFNHAADSLSRAPNDAMILRVDDEELAFLQRSAADIHAYQSDIISLKLHDIAPMSGGPTLLCDVSSGQSHPIVTPKLQRHIFNQLHSLSHPEVRVSQRLLGSHFVWSNLRKDVASWPASALRYMVTNGRHFRNSQYPIPHSVMSILT